MLRPTILLTGATGNTGRVLADLLKSRGIPFAAMARSASRRAELEALGIPAVHGDFDDPASLLCALEGIEKAYLVCTPDEKVVERETAFIEAARAAGVKHIVKCSAFWAGLDAPTRNLRSHGEIELALRASGVPWTIIRPHGFMQTFTLFQWNMIEKAGAMSMPAGTGGIPLVDVRDVAEVAFKALTEPGHIGNAYDLTGPEVLTGYQQCAILEKVLGKPVTYIQGSETQLEAIMYLLGVPPVPSEHVIKIFKLQREHAMEETTDTLAELGVVPTRYEQFVRDLVDGKTSGGNSFEPPRTMIVRLMDNVMPWLVWAYLGVVGRGEA
ncbi:NmrA family protein [Hyaloraphidium curvatum]|nr:NmrA family protein [Hyaloraphidium curvatum]